MCSRSVYSVVGASSIKEGNAFRFSALTQNLLEPLSANFSLSGYNLDGKLTTLASPNVVLSRDDVLTLEFDVRII